jgi:hypothetical protein
VSIHEPRRTTKDIRKLRTKVAEDPGFESIVDGIRCVMEDNDAAPNLMRAAVRLVLHEDAWRTYRHVQDDALIEEEEDVEEDGYDPLEI